MKKLTILLCNLALVFGVVGNAIAIDFTVNPGGSEVVLDNVWGWGSLDADMALTASTFDLDIGGTGTIDFFTLSASGAGGGYATIDAILDFSSPYGLSGSGSGGAHWGSLGFISGGILNWTSQPGSMAI